MIYEDEFLKLFSEFFLTKVVFFLTCSPYGMCAAQAQRYNMQLLGPWKKKYYELTDHKGLNRN